jgi:hypothetical protein
VDIARELACATEDDLGDLLGNADPSSRVLEGHGGGGVATDHLPKVLDFASKTVIGWQWGSQDLTINLNSSGRWAGGTERTVKVESAVLTYKRESLREWTFIAAPRRPERS